jgi:DNA-binding CsgD family transcriptional regulator
LVDEVDRLGARGLARHDYFGEIAARLRRVVDCDAACWHTLDPQTLLMTSDRPDELVAEGVFSDDTIAQAGQLLVASEYLVDDVNTFASLARRRSPVGILSEATRGRPQRSARYRELLAPAGIPHELRASFVIHGRTWGAVHIARREERPDFTRADAEAVAPATAAIAEGIRRSIRFEAASVLREDGAPGLVVLDAKDHVELITAPAAQLFEAMRPRSCPGDRETPPNAVLTMAAITRRQARDGRARPGALAVPMPSGWITLHASLPDGRAHGKIAIALERSPSEDTTPVRLEAHGLTKRERDVAGLVAQGRSNPEIAAELVLSPYTVQDHIKSIFEKTGATTRGEFVARVFLDDYLPRLAERAPLSASGGFAE